VNPSVFAVLSIAILILAGCAEVERRQLGDCAQWFERLDETVDGASVRDAGAYRVANFP
jgi:type IV pilus biogenesis protein CpaD/CtpE